MNLVIKYILIYELRYHEDLMMWHSLRVLHLQALYLTSLPTKIDLVVKFNYQSV